MPVNEEWYNALCHYGSFPRTQWTRRFFDEWAQWENVPEWICNPLATTEPAPELRSTTDLGYGPGKWNNANPPYGVGIYKSQAAGGQATAKTLRNGFYPALTAAIDGQNITDPIGTSANIRKWGTTGFAQKVQDGWEPVGNTTPAPPPVPPVVVPVTDDAEEIAKRVFDENFPVYFREMTAAYWTNHPSDYTDSAGNPVPPDEAVVKAVAESVLEYWWGRIG